MKMMTKELRTRDGHHDNIHNVRIKSCRNGRAQAVGILPKKMRHCSVALIIMQSAVGVSLTGSILIKTTPS